MKPEVEAIVKAATLNGEPEAQGFASAQPTWTFHSTDVGNAERLVLLHGHDLRHCPELGWLAFTGSRWELDVGKVLVGRRAEETVRAMYTEATALPDKTSREALIKHALSSESERRIQAMIAAAERGPDIPIRPEELDKDGWLLTCANGTLDLRTAELRAHRREDLITKIIPVAYNHRASCPLWEGFLAQVLARDQGLIRFVQKGVGYSLTADAREQVLFLLYGTGANGKSTFIKVCLALLGDYARTTPMETLLVKRGESIPNDIARLRAARFVAATETEGGKRLAEALVKQLTGGDVVTARFLHREYFEFEPTFKLWIAVNHKPVIRGETAAIWRRIRLLPFTVTIPEDQQDKELPAKLLNELPGIFAWAVEGCRAWRKDGGLGLPEAVRAATQQYRDDMDVLGDFLRACCVKEAAGTIDADDLYPEYAGWCEKTSEKPMTKNLLTMKLKERGFVRRQSGRSGFWVGLRLRLPGEVQAEAEPTANVPIGGTSGRSEKESEQEVIHLDD